jgi:sensor histidine kinase YesM
MKKAFIYLSICLFSVCAIFPINTSHAIIAPNTPLSTEVQVSQISASTTTQKSSKFKNWLVKKMASKETKRTLLIILLVLGIALSLFSAYYFFPEIIHLIRYKTGDLRGIAQIGALVTGSLFAVGLLMTFFAIRGLKKLKNQ